MTDKWVLNFRNRKRFGTIRNSWKNYCYRITTGKRVKISGIFSCVDNVNCHDNFFLSFCRVKTVENLSSSSNSVPSREFFNFHSLNVVKTYRLNFQKIREWKYNFEEFIKRNEKLNSLNWFNFLKLNSALNNFGNSTFLWILLTS